MGKKKRGRTNRSPKTENTRISCPPVGNNPRFALGKKVDGRRKQAPRLEGEKKVRQKAKPATKLGRP